MKNYKLVLLLAAISVAIASEPATKKKILCYFTNWSIYHNNDGQFSSSNVDPFQCSHIIYAFESIQENGSIRILDPWSDFGKLQLANITALKKINPELKILVAIGGYNEGSTKFSVMAADPVRRGVFINSTIEFLLKNDLDGMDLDWEYPGRNNGDEAHDKENYVTLIKEIREAFDKHSFLLTAAVAPTGRYVDVSYDVPALSKYLDYINLMEYDYHGYWDGYTGHNAPLFASPTDTSPEQKSWNINYSVKQWIQEGADPAKLILGIPFYGHSYKLDDPSNVNIGSSTWTPGPPGPNQGLSGALAYNEVCEFILQGNWTIKWDKFALVPYMYKDGIWVSYDSVESIKWKTVYALKQNLGGVMIWSLDDDDFLGNCGKKNILLGAIHEVLGW